jgi:DNA-binding MarR family transcriptional regulator
VIILAIGTLPAMTSTTWQPGTLTMLSLLSKSVYRRTTESMLGMSQRRYLALNYVAEPSGISQQQLGEILCMDANNMVLLLNELEDDGLIRRERDPGDRRRHIVRLTEQGSRAFSAAQRNRESLEDEVLAALSPEERETLHQLLAKALDR